MKPSAALSEKEVKGNCLQVFFYLAARLVRQENLATTDQAFLASHRENTVALLQAVTIIKGLPKLEEEFSREEEQDPIISFFLAAYQVLIPSKLSDDDRLFLRAHRDWVVKLEEAAAAIGLMPEPLPRAEPLALGPGGSVLAAGIIGSDISASQE